MEINAQPTSSEYVGSYVELGSSKKQRSINVSLQKPGRVLTTKFGAIKKLLTNSRRIPKYIHAARIINSARL